MHNATHLILNSAMGMEQRPAGPELDVLCVYIVRSSNYYFYFVRFVSYASADVMYSQLGLNLIVTTHAQSLTEGHMGRS